MKRISIVILIALFVSVLPQASRVLAQKATGDSVEPYAGDVLCQPDAYLMQTEGCLPLGPSSFLTDLARQGIPYPLRPLPASKPDPALSVVNINYAKLNLQPLEPAPIYGSLEDAIAGTNPKRFMTGGKGLRYVSFVQSVNTEGGGHYVQLAGGEWMRASPASVLSTFQGLIFHQNPQNSFGWMFDNTKARSAPTYKAPEVGDVITKESLVQIYKKVNADDTDWYMIGFNQWVERRFIRQFVVNTKPPTGVENNRWIEVNLYEQTLGVYENGQLQFATLIATGAEPYFTRPGLFKIIEKKPTENMSGAFNADKSDYYYLADVPWTMYFDDARAIHGAYWRAWFGIPQSHGCVNLSIGDARWVFDWAKTGDYVYVWDPSGKTPTDPKFYGKGGA